MQVSKQWFQQKGWQPQAFQLESWDYYQKGYHTLINAPTGSGKTYAALLPILEEQLSKPHQGLRAIWITPIKALAKEIQLSAERAIEGLGMDWKVAIRSGDTPANVRAQIKKKPPQLLITTPESLHLMLAQKGYAKYFKNVTAFVVDEWHELMGTKRGVQIELGLSRLKAICPQLKICGISATIGNLDEALEVLLGTDYQHHPHKLIKADIHKKLIVETIFPKTIETLPWAGHIGIKLLDQIIPKINESTSTLIFVNTRSMVEIWYQNILAKAPELAGQVAIHHGSISKEIRYWVEESLYEGKLKAVVCTSSLDLGVDFRPVETIIQIGSPKGVSRFMQRAGRSGHQPNATSKIYFVPTHSLELVEAAALRQAIQEQKIESRIPYFRSFDVLIQYLMTLAVSDGYTPTEIFAAVQNTFSFQTMTEEEWYWIHQFLTVGGTALGAYDEFHKVVVEDGIYKVTSRKIAMQHRLSIGTIVSDSSLQVKFQNGQRIGVVEEWFISRIKVGDAFWFAGKSVELVRIRGMEVTVKRSKKKTGPIPSWMGGRMPLSSQMSSMIRRKIAEAYYGDAQEKELTELKALLALQQERSHVPNLDEFLVEYFQTKDGYHLVFFPFEGRFVHEGIASLIAYRIAQLQPISFSIAMNDYGFELLSDIPIPVEEMLSINVFDTQGLTKDIQASINSVEMARRAFRDIASISGLVFKGFPGKQVKDKHLQSSAHLFFEVFTDYEKDNLLLLQAYEEVMQHQLEEARLRAALERIMNQKIIIKEPIKPSPFAFPIIVDRLNREKLSSESLEQRVEKLLEAYA